jgi:hypothetical protein
MFVGSKLVVCLCLVRKSQEVGTKFIRSLKNL